MERSEEKVSIVPLALEYYDKIKEKHASLFKKVKSHKLIVSPYDMERNKITLYDQFEKELLTSEYEIIGIYHNKFKIWSWAWSVPIFKKNSIYISRNILNYGLDLDTTEFLKTELITSRFLITNPIQSDIHISIATYLAKKVPFSYRYYPDEHNKENFVVYHIFLLDIDKENKEEKD
jgi:hypothetical protein